MKQPKVFSRFIVFLFIFLFLSFYGVRMGEAYPVVDFSPEVLNSKQNIELKDCLTYLEKGKYDIAIGKAKAFLKAHPSSAPAQEILGAALAKKGEFDAALDALQKAVQINPNQSSAITKMGDIYLARGELGKAKEAFLKAIAIAPENRWAHQRLGLLYEREGNSTSAIEHLEK